MPFDGKNYQTNTTADVLRRARALIDTPEKWTREGPFGTSRHCTGTALMRAAGLFNGWDERLQDEQAAHVFIKANKIYSCGCVRGAIACWNDVQERTHADILAAFDKAIALAEAS